MGDDKDKDKDKERNRQFDLVDDLIGAAVDTSIGLGVNCDDVVDIMLHTIYEHYRDGGEAGHGMTVDQAVAALATKVAEFMAAATAQDHDDDEEPRPPSEKPS